MKQAAGKFLSGRDMASSGARLRQAGIAALASSMLTGANIACSPTGSTASGNAANTDRLQVNTLHAVSGAEPVKLGTNGRIAIVRFKVDSRSPAMRMVPTQSSKGSAKCRLRWPSERLTCTTIITPVDVSLEMHIVPSGYSHYLMLGGYGCEQEFCLNDIADSNLLHESDDLLEMIEARYSFIRRRTYKGPVFIAWGSSLLKLRSWCIYPRFDNVTALQATKACNQMALKG